MHKLYRFHPCICWIVMISCVVIINDNYKVLSCLEEEKMALLKLNDTLSYIWGNEEPDCCSWAGVTCNTVSKRITTLYFNVRDSHSIKTIYFYLDASLFQSFEELQNLTYQRGGIKGISGPLSLPKLQVLDLSSNEISHVPLMGELPSLKFLDLSNNDISGDDFQELTNLTRLEVLKLGRNHIAGQIPPSILALASLKMLRLFFNMLNGSLPDGLCALTNLEELDLSMNEFEGVIPTCLSNLTSLKMLGLSQKLRLPHKMLNGSLPDGLCALTNLEELDLSRNEFTGVIPTCLSNLTSLWLLDLSWNNFSGSIPSNLFSSLKSLQYISLSYNHFDSVSFGSFADNSKLEVFELQNYNPKLKVETERKVTFFHLKVFRLSNCILNEPYNVIPSFLLSQYDLRVVDISNNGMTGVLPSWLITNNSKLQYLSLRNNFFSGQLILQLDSYHAYMASLDVSMNQVVGEIPAFIGYILPNLTYLNMSTNAIDGSIPSSIENMNHLESLDLSNNHLSGDIHGDLFNGCENLNVLKLSNNNLGGNLKNFLSSILGLPYLLALYLDSNNFSGDIQLETSHLAHGNLLYLDISNNSITGRFPDWIAELSYLQSLVLSKNQFDGELPTSFCNLSLQLMFLDLSWNNFSDTLPPCTNLSSLSFLHLQGNGFYGPLPTSLSRSSTLVTLDVRYNKFSGLIATWISSLADLTILMLKGNLFHGAIPSELCKMKNLNILDLAANNLSGLVPPCLSHIPFGKERILDLPFGGTMLVWEMPTTRLHIRQDYHEKHSTSSGQEEVQFITKSMTESYKGDILHFLSGIDLSLNKLTGHIPLDFGKMDMIYSLNLSYNYFNGSIPWTLSKLKNMESLDLSHNMLSGEIPSEMISMTSLSAFSVAYNNLSGPTPKWTNQFGTFNASCYEGNPLLCGLPLDTNCSGQSMPPPHGKPSAELEQNESSFTTSFLWSFFGSFVVSCIGSFVFFFFSTNVPQILLGWIGVKEKAPHRTTVELTRKWNK